ncbi:MAG: C1 family peptidase [Bacteroidaceae bacterium]|nr:C1 family peptidase [Bacteroidaceae bacterium]
MKKHLFTAALLLLTTQLVCAQSLTPELLSRIQAAQTTTTGDKVIRNALAAGDIQNIAVNQSNQGELDTYFTYSVPTKGITDQKGSGRCWMFTGLNVLRSQMIRQHHLEGMEFSQVYLFFYDQLEKSNLFLQAVIDTRTRPMEDKTVEWLFKNPLSDGGTFTGIADLTAKYGVVPAGVMPETYASNNTSRFTSFLKRKLREDGMRLRKAGKKDNLQAMKEEMLVEIYHMLALGFGEPVKSFKWAPKDKDGKYISEPKEYTPKEFYDTFLGNDLQNGYIMLMNDPTHEYWKTYEIEYDRHTYDGHNWRYLNLPLDDIKEMAVASIKDSTVLYFSCDVGKELDRSRGLLDLNNFDYGSIFGTTFGMNKEERIRTFDSGSTHAMTLKSVRLEDGKPTMWEVENSWGAESGRKGFLIMTDEWFDAYMFRLVVEKKYAPEKVLKAYEQKATLLPCWDPMFTAEE